MSNIVAKLCQITLAAKKSLSDYVAASQKRETTHYAHVWETSGPGKYPFLLSRYRLGNRLQSGCNKKLSYSRETARQLHTSFSAHSLIVHFTEHRICFTTLYNRLAKRVSTQSANKPCDIRSLSWIGHSRSFKVILIGAGRNPEWSVVAICN